MTTHRVAALFVQKGGTYFGPEFADVDPWDVERDAMGYGGPLPVVAHPPCSRWCRLAGVVEARWGHRRGEDGGTFASALESVRRFGGVLEHPAYTDAWPAFGLPAPVRGGWCRCTDGGWVCHVEQGLYGSRARKATWLYAFGVEAPPSLLWGAAIASATVSFMTNHGGGSLPRLSKREASKSPASFARMLVELAASAARTEAA